jgi:hypothetical protein
LSLLSLARSFACICCKSHSDGRDIRDNPRGKLMRYNALSFLISLCFASEPTPDELPSEWRALYVARTAAHIFQASSQVRRNRWPLSTTDRNTSKRCIA